jgi:hypothetical protein
MRAVTRAMALSVLLASAALLPGAAAASTSVVVAFDALVHASTVAALVTPISQRSLWEAGRIVTYTEVQVDEILGGAVGGGALWVRTLGGEVGTVGQLVDGEPVLSVGRPALLFLHPAHAISSAPSPVERPQLPGTFVVTARAQGQFPVVVDEHHELRLHRSSAVGFTVPVAGPGAATPAAEVLHGLRVSDASVTLASVWGRLHAP